MTNIHRQFDSLVVAAIATLLVSSSSAWAVVPISGRPVATMTIFDTTMTDFMEDNSIDASVLGIMNNGQIVFLRGYGSLDDGVDMPENALVRLASCNKPITAAAIRAMDAQSASFSVNNFAFNLNGNGGVLNSVPFGGMGDARLPNITVLHLLRHRGGWNRNPPTVNYGSSPDYTNQEWLCATLMLVESPPGRNNMMRWILGQPLDFAPGAFYEYSNVGYMALSLIVSTTDAGYVDYVHQNVLTPAMWVPETEVEQARTFRIDRNLREPWYESNNIVSSVFDSTPGFVFRPYGGNDIEGRLGLGGVIASAAAMLTLGNTYHIAPDSAGTNPNIGLPINATNPFVVSETHSGSKSGVNTTLWHRLNDGVVVFVFCNKDEDEYDGAAANGHYGSKFVNLIDPILDAGSGVQFTWPTTTSDGFWVQTNSLAAGGAGGYHDPFLGVDDAMAYVTEGSKLRLKAGTSTWTGTLNKKLLIDAPLGNATIGQ